MAFVYYESASPLNRASATGLKLSPNVRMRSVFACPWYPGNRVPASVACGRAFGKTGLVRTVISRGLRKLCKPRETCAHSATGRWRKAAEKSVPVTNITLGKSRD